MNYLELSNRSKPKADDIIKYRKDYYDKAKAKGYDSFWIACNEDLISMYCSDIWDYGYCTGELTEYNTILINIDELNNYTTDQINAIIEKLENNYLTDKKKLAYKQKLEEIKQDFE
jgi:hypothetical protein